MKSVLAVTFVSALIGTAMAQQPLPAPPPSANQPTAGQTTSPANQGVAANPTGDPRQPALTTTTDPASGTARSPLAAGTNQVGGGGTAPLFINVTPTTITDANGSPIGVLQQLALTPSGAVNFGLVNMGGRLVPVPWQMIVTGTGGARGSLAVNADRGLLQTAPPVLMGQIPTLTQDDIQAQILGHFGLQAAPNAQPTVVTTGTARGGTGGAGVTITGGTTNTTTATGTFGTATNATGILTNAGTIPNITRSNQAVNTTGGLLSPTGRTNAAFDGFNSGPGSTDRLGPRQNTSPGGNPPPVTAPPANTPNSPGRPIGQPKG
jgi:hypothetical protein